jgi:hypothetical protein
MILDDGHVTLELNNGASIKSEEIDENEQEKLEVQY